jgi:hypothetical protein
MSSQPYASIRDHLRDELAWLDHTLEHAVRGFTRPRRPAEFEQFGGLILGETEVLDELHTPAGRNLRPDGPTAAEWKTERRHIEDRIAATRAAGQYLPFLYLGDVLQLRALEQQCLLLALAPELDRKYERVFAYLHDDVTRKLPTVELSLALFCKGEDERWAGLQAFHSGSVWRRFAMLDIADLPDGPHPLLSRRLRLDDRIVQFLLGSSALDNITSRFGKLTWEDGTQASPEHEDLLAQLRRLFDAHFGRPSAGSLVIQLVGRYGAGREAVANAAAAHLGLPTLWVDLRSMVALESADQFDVALQRLFREALLQPAAIGLRDFHSITPTEGSSAYHLAAILDALRTYSRLTFLLTEEPWALTEFFREETFLSLPCPVPSYEVRSALWAELLRAEDRFTRPDVAEVASKFRFTPGQIRDALAEARTRAALAGSPGQAIDINGLHAACRTQASPRFGDLARKVAPIFGWDSIVLPDNQIAQLREIAAHVRHAPNVMGCWGFEARFPLGRAVTALFAGSSGTGKTMAAEILASDLQLDLFKVDLSAVVSKYIGETEKNLHRIFREAQSSNAILFFDEADALFGKRSEVKDSHDRYANIEIAYLLQRMEEYDGIVILATNLKKNLDEAFVRRMRFIVDFPLPRQADRARIWRTIFPAEAPVSSDIDFDFLARKLSITGGNIKNIALRAAYLAAQCGAPAIEMGCIIEAAKRELDKIGKLYTEDEFGTLSTMVPSRVGEVANGDGRREALLHR